MQFSEMVTELADRVGDVNHTTTSEATKKKYINQAVKRLYREMYDMGDQEISTTTVTTSAGTQEYNLPADFTYARRVYITNESPLSYDSHRIKGIASDKAKPTNYYTQGNYSSLGSGTPVVTYIQIGFTPMPDAAYTYNIDYFPIVADMTEDADICGIPVDFHELIVVTAACKITVQKGQRKQLQMFEKERERLLEDLRMHFAQRQKYNAPSFNSVYPGLSWAERELI